MVYEKMKISKIVLSKNLKFEYSSFDYINISMAYQWLDQAKFLSEVKRILKPDGILGVDNYGFTGQMIEDQYFRDSYKAYNLINMKPAARYQNYPDENQLNNAGIQFLSELQYEHQLQMTKPQFINYLMTRSHFLDLGFETRKKVLHDMGIYFHDLFEN